MNQYSSPIIRAGTSLDAIGKQAPRVNSLALFYEDWQEDFLDAAKWGYTVTVTGQVYADAHESQSAALGAAGILRAIAANDTATLWTRKAFMLPHGQTALTTIVERLHFEWEMECPAAANIANATTFFGMAQLHTHTRTSTNLLGFYFDSDILRVVTDATGAETTSALTTAPTVTTLHKYRISVDRVNGALFYVDDVLQATITTNIPNTRSMYLHFYVDHEAIQKLFIGRVRIYQEDLI